MHMILSENRPLRTATLCVLYVAQGIPYGFVSIALAAWLSEAPQSWELKKISFVMAAAISPWTFKWAWGPLLDTWTIRSCGRRRPWILLAQFFMAVTIGGMLFVPDLAADVDTLIALIFLHNIFASLQDVSVDALAVDLLESEERERVSGYMYGSSYFGTFLGGTCLGMILANFGMRITLMVQAGFLLAIMMLPLFARERAGDLLWPGRQRQQPLNNPDTTPAPAFSIAPAIAMLKNLLRAFSLRSTLLSAVFALSTRLGMGVLTVIGIDFYTKELGWTQEDYSIITGTYGILLGLVGSVLGGWLADRFGQKRMAALSTVGLGLVWILFSLASDYWTMKPVVGAMLVLQEFLAAILTVSLMAMFIQVSWPQVAATQFTAYMAFMNLSMTGGSLLAEPVSNSYGKAGSFLVGGLLQASLVVLLPFIDTQETRRRLETTDNTLPAGPVLDSA